MRCLCIAISKLIEQRTYHDLFFFKCGQYTPLLHWQESVIYSLKSTSSFQYCNIIYIINTEKSRHII
jgi:hypothetical protein